MGTRGYYVFKFQGVYYVIYNHYDSYPSGLGETITYHLRATWSRMSDAQVLAYLHSQLLDSTIEFVTETLPHTTLFIEWIYIIDLDARVLKVCDSGHMFTIKFSHFIANWCTLFPFNDQALMKEAVLENLNDPRTPLPAPNVRQLMIAINTGYEESTVTLFEYFIGGGPMCVRAKGPMHEDPVDVNDRDDQFYVLLRASIHWHAATGRLMRGIPALVAAAGVERRPLVADYYWQTRREVVLLVKAVVTTQRNTAQATALANIDVVRAVMDYLY